MWHQSGGFSPHWEGRHPPSLDLEFAEHTFIQVISYRSVFKEKKSDLFFFFLENLRGNKVLLIFFLTDRVHDCRAVEVSIFHSVGENLLLSGTGGSTGWVRAQLAGQGQPLPAPGRAGGCALLCPFLPSVEPLGFGERKRNRTF